MRPSPTRRRARRRSRTHEKRNCAPEPSYVPQAWLVGKKDRSGTWMLAGGVSKAALPARRHPSGYRPASAAAEVSGLVGALGRRTHAGALPGEKVRGAPPVAPFVVGWSAPVEGEECVDEILGAGERCVGALFQRRFRPLGKALAGGDAGDRGDPRITCGQGDIEPLVDSVHGRTPLRLTSLAAAAVCGRRPEMGVYHPDFQG